MLKESKDSIRKDRETYKESLVILKKYYEMGTDFCETIDNVVHFYKVYLSFGG